MDLYLDINGVLIDNRGEPARHLTEFMAWATRNHACFWLSTICRGQDDCLGYLRDRIPSQALGYAKQVLPTAWDAYKTEAVVWDRDFRWIDDYLSDQKKHELEKHGALSKFVLVDLDRNPNQLREIIQTF